MSLIELKQALLREEVIMIKTKDEEPFTLESGKKSRLFINIKKASLNPCILKCMVKQILKSITIKYDYCDLIGSVAIGGIPIASALSYAACMPQIIVRTEKHDRGMKTQIIGNCDYQDVLLIEDVSTTGESIINAVKAIRNAKGICNYCIVIVDRDEGAIEKCKNNKIELIPLLSKKDFGITEDDDKRNCLIK